MTEPVASTPAGLCPACGVVRKAPGALCLECGRQVEAIASAWRSEAVVILRPQARLPLLCLACAKTATGGHVSMRVRQTAQPFKLTAIHPILFLIAQLVATRKSRVSVPLCTRHRRLLRLGLIVGWALVPPATLASVWGLTTGSTILMLSCLYVALASGVFAALTAFPARAIQIDGHFVHLRGAHLALLDQLPDWHAFDEPTA
jgi:hypothetical protein